MKMKLLHGFVAGLALACVAPAGAADMGAKAPALAPAFSWARCYVGAHAGYGWGRSDQGGDIVTSTGGLAGVQAGCNWQAAASLIVGVEGDLSWSGMRGNGDFFDVFNYSYTTRNLWDADLTLRLGLPVDRALIYVKGGGAYGAFSADYREPATPANNDAVSYNKVGWLIGVGLEYALASNWSAKVEYNYVDFGRSTVNWPTGAQQTGETKQVVKFGVNYLFGGPVVAKY